MTGLKIGRLSVIKFSHIDEKTHVAMWLCDCDCGNKNILKRADVLTRKKPTLSCGCLQKEKIKEIDRTNFRRRPLLLNKYDIFDEYCVGYDSNNNKYYVDTDDYDLIKNHTWRLDPSNNYFCTAIDGKKVYLHRLIMGCTFGDKKIVDHINGDRSDCRKANLRIVTYLENAWNAKTINPYGAKNIRNRGGSYEVRIGYKNSQFQVGSFSNLDDAIAKRIEVEKELYPEYRREENE